MQRILDLNNNKIKNLKEVNRKLSDSLDNYEKMLITKETHVENLNKRIKQLIDEYGELEF